MDYNGKFEAFDFSRIRTYPLNERVSKVRLGDLADPDALEKAEPAFASPEFDAVVEAVGQARAKNKPVMIFTGAHLIKNGYGPLARRLLERGIITSISMNAAGMIHDLELALTGMTSENVPAALPKGEFGFAEETGRLINRALTHGHSLQLGAGESLARLILGEAFPDKVEFPHAGVSVIAGAWRAGRPATMHASIGTDVIDQHPDFDPAAKGGTSGRDFAIFCAEVEKLAGGGVFLNIGSSVSGPEVFLKACSMAANVRHPPTGIVTASFDFRPANVDAVDDEREASYYLRDIKSVVARIPEAFNGRGHYIQGDHLKTLPALYTRLCNIEI